MKTTTDIEQLFNDYADTWDDIIGGIWLHAKGSLYAVLGVSVCSETKEVLVTYREVNEYACPVSRVPAWTRPRSMWDEMVEAPSGALVPRFERVTGGKDHLAELRAMRGL